MIKKLYFASHYSFHHSLPHVAQVYCTLEIIRHLNPFLPPQLLLFLFDHYQLLDDDSRRRVVYAVAAQSNHTVREVILTNVTHGSRITTAFHLIPPIDPFHEMLPSDDDDDVLPPPTAHIEIMHRTIHTRAVRPRRFVPPPLGENRHPNLQ